ncbi:hypothetical protein JOB18_026074 [Solea senegalensis]|uniref:Uncharacterized protein n=1 Tax=Solea senegalensis TaxID=28829 RepID=A0AAV6QIL1_SOLSE|nr:hypothetical protein JOB18_026074 [Solea senegalensis]
MDIDLKEFLLNITQPQINLDFCRNPSPGRHSALSVCPSVPACEPAAVTAASAASAASSSSDILIGQMQCSGTRKGSWHYFKGCSALPQLHSPACFGTSTPFCFKLLGFFSFLGHVNHPALYFTPSVQGLAVQGLAVQGLAHMAKSHQSNMIIKDPPAPGLLQWFLRQHAFPPHKLIQVELGFFSKWCAASRGTPKPESVSCNSHEMLQKYPPPPSRGGYPPFPGEIECLSPYLATMTTN